MKTLTELQADREHLIRCANDIRERSKNDDDRSYTSEEKADLANFQEGIARLDNEIQERRTKDQYDATIEAQMNSLSPTGTVAAPMEPNNTGEPPRPADVVPYQRRYGKLKAFKGPDAERRAFRTGKFLQAALFGDLKADRWCTQNGMDWRALSIGTNTAGGFLVPDEMATTIIDLRDEYGVFRRECDVMPMSRDMMTIPRRSGGVTATFTGENTALTESDPTFNQVTLSARKLGVLTRISSELSEDSIINIADWVTQEFSWAFAKMEDDCGFKGDGSTTYGTIHGLLNRINDGNHTASLVTEAATKDTFPEITAAKLGEVVGTLPTYAHAGAKWFISQYGWGAALERLAYAAGGVTVQQFEGGMQKSFMGYPVVISASCPGSGTHDEVPMLYFGNLKMACTLGDRREITVALSNDRYFVEDQVAIKATERFDIACHDLGDTSTAGPLVALRGNTA